MGHNTCKSMGRVLCVVRRYASKWRFKMAAVLKNENHYIISFNPLTRIMFCSTCVF